MTGSIGAGGYWREISAVLALKAAGIAILWGLFFGPAHRMPVGPEAVARHLEQSGGQP